MDARRVLVTGHDRAGKAVFVSDEPVDPVTTTLLQVMEFHLLWDRSRPPGGRVTRAGAIGS